MINDQLLYQLMKSEENKQVFEKLMVLIFQFIKEKKVTTKKDDSQVIQQQAFGKGMPQENINCYPTHEQKMMNAPMSFPQTPNVVPSNKNTESNPNASILKPDGTYVQANVLDGMVSQLKMIKNSIYNDQLENANQQQLIDNLLKQADQRLPNQNSNNTDANSNK